MPSGRSGACAAVLNGEVFVMGGKLNGLSVRTVEIFNPLTLSWRTGPELAVARDAAMAASHNGRIWVFGGHTILTMAGILRIRSILLGLATVP